MIIIFVTFFLVFMILWFMYTNNNPTVKHTKAVERQILINYSNNINEIMNRLKDPNISTDEKITNYKKLAKIYHYGIPNTFIENELVRGIDPEPQKAISMYKQIGMMGDLSVLIEWASIHHYGIPGFNNLQDSQKAREIYLHLYYKTNDSFQKQEAKKKLDEMGVEIEQMPNL